MKIQKIKKSQITSYTSIELFVFDLANERAFVTEQLSYFLCKFFLTECIYEQDKATELMLARCIFIFMLIERRVVVVFRIYIKHHLFTRLLSLSSSSLLPPPPSVHKVLFLACFSVYCLVGWIYLILFSLLSYCSMFV
jgi:hypothetical protein